MEFLETTYEAGANLAKWDRAALERPDRNRVAHRRLIWQNSART